MLNALILAGSKEKGPLEIAEKVDNKTLIMINNKPVIEYIIDVLNNTESIAQIVVVGPKKELSPFISKKVKEILDSGNSILDNMKKGLKYFDSNDNLLILTSDIPLITPTAVEEFIKICNEKNVDIGYPIITKENILKKYPETKRTYVKMKEGILCGGNIIFFKPEVFFKNKKLIQELFDNRKDNWKNFQILGLKMILKYLFKTLTIEEVEKKATKMIGYKSMAIMVSHPEIMIDLDKPSDLELIKKCLEK